MPTESTPDPGPPAPTAAEQDHSDPWAFAGQDADPPEDCGQPAAD
ncbi:MAG: hypothetical protein ACRD0V_09210 [Acidimicrobiales bacterium]